MSLLNRTLVILTKAKFLKRWRGKDQKYHYKYTPDNPRARLSIAVRRAYDWIFKETGNRIEAAVALDENGTKIVMGIGGQSNVDFSPTEQAVMKKKCRIMIHNHPANRTFSPTDLCFGVDLQLPEMHVISTKTIYKLKIDHVRLNEYGIFTYKQMEDTLRPIEMDVYKDLWVRMGTGQMEKEQADDEFCYRVLKGFMKQYKGAFKYAVKKT